eukprot:1787930-Rhodomonas_salina.1
MGSGLGSTRGRGCGVGKGVEGVGLGRHPARLLAQRVSEMTAAFWEMVVLGREKTEHARNEFTPSASNPPWKPRTNKKGGKREKEQKKRNRKERGKMEIMSTVMFEGRTRRISR